jgi:hypothetical protein
MLQVISTAAAPGMARGEDCYSALIEATTTMTARTLIKGVLRLIAVMRVFFINFF